VGFSVWEALAFSELTYLCETQKIDIIILAADVDEARARELKQRFITIKLHSNTLSPDVVSTLCQMFPNAKQPTRWHWVPISPASNHSLGRRMAATVWKGHLTFGLVSIPVRLHAAARSKSVRFNQLYRRSAPAIESQPDENIRSLSEISPFSSSSVPSANLFSRVTQELRSAGEQPINREDLVKGYEYSPDQYVVVEKSEIENLVPKTSTTMDLHRFVKLSEIDPLFFERSYYVAPESGGEKPYALLLQAMQRTGYCGVANVAMHRREHVVILRPHEERILAHTMFYIDEIREAPDLSIDRSLVTEKELGLAEAFIKALAGPFEPESFRDEYRESLKSLIDAKVQGQEVLHPAPARTLRPPIDIMQALKASLEQVQANSSHAAKADKKTSGSKSKKRRVA
jgi:DNA end-binding protein Ku